MKELNQEKILIELETLKTENQILKEKYFELQNKCSDLQLISKQYQLIFDNAPLGITTIGLDGKYLSINKAYTDIFGYSYDELLNQNYMSITLEEDKELSEKAFDELITGNQQIIKFEKRYIHKNGSIVHTIASGKIIFGSDYKPLFVLGMIEDITKLINAQESLEIANQQLEAKVEERTFELRKAKYLLGIELENKLIANNKILEQKYLLRQIIDLIPHYICAKNKEDKIVLSNKAFASLFQSIPRDIIGIRMSDLLYSTDDCLNSNAESITVLNERKNANVPLDTITDYKGNKHYLQLYLKPFTINNENVVLSFGTDITDRHVAEEAYRILVNNSIQGLLIFQNKGYIFTNKRVSELTGYSEVELSAMKFNDIIKLIYPEDRHKVIVIIKKLRDNESSFSNLEYRIIRKDHQIRWVNSYSKRIIYNNDYAVQQAIVDITEKKNYEAQLKQTNEKLQELISTKDRFFSIVSHDMKNSFNVINGFSEILIQQFNSLDEETKLNYLNKIYNSGDITFKLLQNLLDWSGIQRGLMTFSPEYIDIFEVISNNIALYRDIAKEKSIEINSLLMKNTIVYSDQNMLNTIFRNLISNAIKFSFNGGNVVIFSSNLNSNLNSENQLMIVIKDNGIGIASENLNKIFKIDEQYIIQGTENETGTGIGLILCKELVEKQGGKIWVESKPGKGSKFCFTIPLSKKNEN